MSTLFLWEGNILGQREDMGKRIQLARWEKERAKASEQHADRAARRAGCGWRALKPRLESGYSPVSTKSPPR
jgi:hypothetical protein